jgi:hypothetical protein
MILLPQSPECWIIGVYRHICVFLGAAHLKLSNLRLLCSLKYCISRELAFLWTIDFSHIQNLNF